MNHGIYSIHMVETYTFCLKSTNGDKYYALMICLSYYKQFLQKSQF